MILHRAERADLLAGALADLLADAPGDPFAREVVAVPTRGVERWLAQTLGARLGAGAGGDGVCANVAFPFPGRIVATAVAHAAGIAPEADPWPPERLAWPLLDVAEAAGDAPWAARIIGTPGDSTHRDRRYAGARHVADLFDRYGVHRPAMLRAWAAGDDEGAREPHLNWQPALWRAVRAHVAVPSPAERLPDACARLRDEPDLVDLPARLALFGLTRIPESNLDVLRALSVHRDVHLFLLHPAPALWARLAAEAGQNTGPRRRADDDGVDAVRNPLMASWGRDAREMQQVLGTGADRQHHLPAPAGPATLLGRLQDDVRADRRPPGAPVGPGDTDLRPTLAPDDRSVQVHACHGRQRQVEVVRDAILHALAEDPTLEPRDIVVMCPDIESFAPLVHAVFSGAGDQAVADRAGAGAPPSLHVRLADRSLRRTNPLLGVAATLLELAAGRMGAAEVLELAGRDPVRLRFGWDDDDLARIARWVEDAGVRWGLDAAHRAPFGLGDLAANTWAAGLDRLLLGVAMDETGWRLFGEVLPLDDVGDGDIDLAGRLAELIARLGDALDALAGPQTAAGWTRVLADALDALCAVPEEGRAAHDELLAMLDDVRTEAGFGDAARELTLAEAHDLFADRLRGRPTSANFRTGHLTVCTLVPMRSVPHRMICLLGLDDDAFPRRPRQDGDDLLVLDPRVGERDRRAEDRQLLLDALMAAGERLVIAHSGRDPRSNLPLPAAVPVGELLDVVDATVRPAGGTGAARTSVVVHHPMHPFDARNFTPGALGATGPWGFDAAAADGARAAGAGRRPRSAFVPAALPPVRENLITPRHLEAFIAAPVRTFLTERLGMNVPREEPPEPDSLPLALRGLPEWAIGTRFVAMGLDGALRSAARRAELARGTLPPGRGGAADLAAIIARAQPVVHAARDARGDNPQASERIDIALPDGRALTGAVGEVFGDTVVIATYSKLKPRDRLRAWVRLVVLTAAAPERPWTAVVVARNDGKADRAHIARLGPLGDDATTRAAVAGAALATLIDLRDRGMCAPLPLFCATSAAYATGVKVSPAKRDSRAASAWTSGYQHRGEDQEPAHVRVWGGRAPWDAIAALEPAAGEAGDGWAMDEPGRFGRLAMRLWVPVLRHETLSRA